MIRVVIEVRGNDMRVGVEYEGMTEVEVGLFLLGVQRAKRKILKKWEEEDLNPNKYVLPVEPKEVGE